MALALACELDLTPEEVASVGIREVRGVGQTKDGRALSLVVLADGRSGWVEAKAEAPWCQRFLDMNQRMMDRLSPATATGEDLDWFCDLYGVKRAGPR